MDSPDMSKIIDFAVKYGGENMTDYDKTMLESAIYEYCDGVSKNRVTELWRSLSNVAAGNNWVRDANEH